MSPSGRFEELVEEGASVSLDGWDFSWFAGRATEERPSWGYASMVAALLSAATAALEVDTGGGEVFAWALEQATARPARLVATESWEPNLEVARRKLERFGVLVERVDKDAPLPFEDSGFDLVVSRHPVATTWGEVGRVLREGGTFCSQQVGAGSNRELTDYLMGPQKVHTARSASRAVHAVERAGLAVTDLREASLRVEFFDVGAVVHFLRKVPWTVPDFTVERYRDRLLALHHEIEQHGSFVCHSKRFLLRATRRAADG